MGWGCRGRVGIRWGGGAGAGWGSVAGELESGWAESPLDQWAGGTAAGV